MVTELSERLRAVEEQVESLRGDEDVGARGTGVFNELTRRTSRLREALDALAGPGR